LEIHSMQLYVEWRFVAACACIHVMCVLGRSRVWVKPPQMKKRSAPLASRDPPFLLGLDAVEDRDRDLGGRKIQTLRYSSGWATKEDHSMTSNCTSKWSFCRGCWSALQLKLGRRNGGNRSGETTRWKCWLIIDRRGPGVWVEHDSFSLTPSAPVSTMQGLSS